MAEGPRKRAILETFKAMGVLAWNVPSGVLRVKRGFAHCAPKGTPDIFVLMPVTGRSLFLEVKDEGEKPMPHQLDKHAELRKQGAYVAVVRTVDEAVRHYVRASCRTIHPEFRFHYYGDEDAQDRDDEGTRSPAQQRATRGDGPRAKGRKGRDARKE